MSWHDSEYLKTMGFALLFGFFFWVADGYFEYLFFYKNLKFMLLEGPETLWQSLVTRVPLHSLFVRISFIFTAAVGGLLLCLFLYRKNMAQRELRRSEVTFSGFFNQGNIGMAIVGAEKQWLAVNGKLCRMLGYGPQELLNISWTETIHPDDLEASLAKFGMVASGEIDAYEAEPRFFRKDGGLIHAHVTVSCTRQVCGAIDKMLVTVQDVTDRKMAEERILHLNNVLRAIRDVNQLIVREKDPDRLVQEGCRLLVDNRGYASSLIVLVDENQRPVFRASAGLAADRQILEDFRNRDELLACCRTCPDRTLLTLTADDKAAICGDCPLAGSSAGRPSLLARLVHGETTFGYLVVALDRNVSLDAEEVGLFSEMAGDLGYALGFLRMQAAHESSERRRRTLENQLLQSQKLEAVGRLAGGVAHDYNNMLGVILGYTEMALDKVETADPLYADLKEIYDAARRSADITRQLLAFARKQTIAPRLLDLNDTVEGMLKMLRRLIGEDIDLQWLPDGDLGPVKIDPTQVDQILANLCVNARDAIAGVGKVTIETANVRFEEGYCQDHAGFTAGDFIMLAVSDDGCGMDRETVDQIFEPFFTTKGLGKGSGLGLATVYGIVRQNEGFINVYSEPGRGATFKVYLPRHAEAVEKPDTAMSRAQIQPGHGETVLLVEDDPAVLKLARRMLDALGYRVVGAATPGEALDLAKSHEGQIHLLITDVVMPEMSGRDLAAGLCGLFPQLRVLFMSGYTANVIAHRGVLDAGVHFVQKPFSREELAARVREALEDGKSAALSNRAAGH